MATENQLTAAINVLANVVRSAYLKRALTQTDPDPHLNFWRVIHGNLLDMAVIDWCKLFGSDDEQHQQVHWKNVFDDHDRFRSGLFQYLGITETKWRDYWTQMKTYRDQQAAHLDFSNRDVTHYPVLDLAIASSCYYYARGVAEFAHLGIIQHPADLRGYGTDFLAQAVKIAAEAVAATRAMQES